MATFYASKTDVYKRQVHDEPVINFIGKDDQLMLSGEIDNLLQYLFRIECTGRVIRIDDNNRFCAVGDLLSHIINVWIPFGLFIADVVDGFSTCLLYTSRCV